MVSILAGNAVRHGKQAARAIAESELLAAAAASILRGHLAETGVASRNGARCRNAATAPVTPWKGAQSAGRLVPSRADRR